MCPELQNYFTLFINIKQQHAKPNRLKSPMKQIEKKN